MPSLNLRAASSPPAAEATARVLDWRPARAANRPGRYSDAFARARAWAVERHRHAVSDKSEAKRAAQRLLTAVPERRELLLRNRDGYGGWWLAAVLAEEARRMAVDRPRAGIKLAELATRVGETLDGEGSALIADVAARAWGALGDLQRQVGDLAAAGESLARARRHLRRGTGEPLIRAEMLESTGRLLADRGRPRARRFLAGAAQVYCDLEETASEGRARVLLALHTLLIQSSGEALKELRLGLERIDRAAEPDLFRAGHRRLAELGAEAPAGSALASAEMGLPSCLLCALSPLDP